MLILPDTAVSLKESKSITGNGQMSIRAGAKKAFEINGNPIQQPGKSMSAA
jgi:hypothetical protein